jgi:hypothetical protein
VSTVTLIPAPSNPEALLHFESSMLNIHITSTMSEYLNSCKKHAMPAAMPHHSQAVLLSREAPLPYLLLLTLLHVRRVEGVLCSMHHGACTFVIGVALA